MITIIAAAGENSSLGKDNTLVWHLPDDFKRFKELTSGNFILMGRKTFESFPKPLPNRKHLIITRQCDYKVPENCYIFDSIDLAIDFCKGEDIWIIGGGEIYKQCMNRADKIELTKVHSDFEADTYFPPITEEWKLESEEFHPKDDRNQYDFTYETYTK